MGAEQSWRDLLEAEQRYFTARGEILRGDPVEVLRPALEKGSGRGAALRILRDLGDERPDLVDALIPELFAQSLGTHPDSARARQVLRARGGDEVAAALAPLVRQAIVRPDMGYQEYYGLVELLQDTGLYDLLDEVAAAGRASPDPDVQESVEHL